MGLRPWYPPLCKKTWQNGIFTFYCPFFPFSNMSQHNSFKSGGSSSTSKRTVLKRFERIDLLKKRGQWKDGDRVIGLRKTRPEE